MSISEIILKSIKEMFWPRRFLPFFFLYFLFSLCVLIFTLPILQLLPSLLLLDFTKTQAAIVLVNVSGLCIVSLIVILTSLWFSGALIHDVYKKKGFDIGLKESQKKYWQLLALGFIIFLFIMLSYVFQNFSIIVRIIIDWIFIFSLPAIVIKKDSFDLALKRSWNFVKKNILETFVFLIITYFIAFVILFISTLLVVVSLFPLLWDIVAYLPLETIQTQTIIQIIYLIINNYPTFVLSSIILSFFLAISQVFILTSRTYYFLELRKKKKIRFY